MKKLILTKKNFWICFDGKEYCAVPADYFTTPNAKLIATKFVAKQWVFDVQQDVTYMQIVSGETVALNVVTMKDLGL
jgi:hypothetical protein